MPFSERFKDNQNVNDDVYVKHFLTGAEKSFANKPHKNQMNI
jgi:hypothetical protein